MDIIQAIFLGLVQGLTEFFPVSSSGHLILAQDIFGIETDNALLFDVMLHVGTLIAVFAVLWKDILGLFKPPFKKLALLAGASVPAALAGYFLNDIFDRLLGNGTFLLVLPFMFLLTASLLAVTEFITVRRAKGQGDMFGDTQGRQPCPRDTNYKGGKPVGIKSAAIMGVAQAIAVIPGLSRSGATICAGVLSGAKRENAAKFSFFMSIPIILGSAAFSLIKAGKGAFDGDMSLTAVAAGMIAAAVSGFFAIKLMLKAISKSNYKWFAAYLGVLFIVTFANYYIVRFF